MRYVVRDHMSKRGLAATEFKESAFLMATDRAKHNPDSRYEVVDPQGRVLFVTPPVRRTR